ncbi:uncharacterized protein DEA37_0011876 [Paragonimus westermani]|uniref:Amino acid transporter n=1 Tax=Paragonimus westermani TaxID=34504 RepID=A0A5J4P2U3_9TREM|nr:uncharacterized protein DEA37_0011876 [Paragonimus westermani]
MLVRPHNENICPLGLPGELFMRALNFSVIPLLACNIVAVTANLKPSEQGMIALLSILYCIVMNLLGSFIGLVTTVLINPGGRFGVLSLHGANRLTSAGKLSMVDVFPDFLRFLELITISSHFAVVPDSLIILNWWLVFIRVIYRLGDLLYPWLQEYPILRGIPVLLLLFNEGGCTNDIVQDIDVELTSSRQFMSEKTVTTYTPVESVMNTNVTTNVTVVYQRTVGVTSGPNILGEFLACGCQNHMIELKHISDSETGTT